MKKNILILGVASVQTDAIRFLQGEGYKVFACAMANDGPGAEIADHFEKINILDIEKIIEFIKEQNISLVYSVGSDLAMPVSAYISEILSLPKFVSEQTAKICNNKDLMRQTLGESFKGNVKFQVLEYKNQEVTLDYPFILKPTDSQGQRGVFLINTHAEFQKVFEEVKQLSRSGKVIIEQYISGQEVSVNGYVVGGKLQYLRTSDRETWEEYTGLIKKHIVPSKHVTQKINMEIEEILEEICQKIGIYNGPVYAQMKIENNKPYIIEVTPRLDGCHMWELLSKYDGINLLKLTFEHLLNNDITEINNKINGKIAEAHVLEFICGKPNTKADFSSINKPKNLINYVKYYEENQNIRSVNGKFEKIGYFIYKL